MVNRRAPIYKINSVVMTFGVIELLCEKGKGLGVTEISGLLDMDKTTAYRILSTLEELGYINRNSQDDTYWFSTKHHFPLAVMHQQHQLNQHSAYL